MHFCSIHTQHANSLLLLIHVQVQCDLAITGDTCVNICSLNYLNLFLKYKIGQTCLVCVCVCLDLWMLCINVERCFESLICCLDLWLSSLLIAFIFMCFSSLEKTFFSSSSLASRQILNKFLSIQPFFLFSRQILNRFSIHRDFLSFFLIESRQLLDPSKKIFELSVCPIASQRFQIHQDFWVSSRQLLDISSIHRDQSFSVNRSSTAPRQIIFCQDLVLDKSSIEYSIDRATFSI